MKAKQIIAEQEKRLETQFRAIDEIALFNQNKVLNAFREERIALRHFNPSHGIRLRRRGERGSCPYFCKDVRRRQGDRIPCAFERNARFDGGVIRDSAPGGSGALHYGDALRYDSWRDLGKG